MSKQIENRLLELVDLEIREDNDDHYLTGLIVPFHQRTDLGAYMEQMSPGVFDKSITERGDRIPLLETHARDRFPIGRSTEFTKTKQGLMATFMLANSERGREALELAKNFVTGLSVGFIPIKSRTSTDGGRKLVTRVEAKLDHIAMVFNPQYDQARIMSVREYDPTDTDIAPNLAKYAHYIKK
tara:strand:+ start:1033 stop:1584 length:552 start_codon:yes stop_codon:yes gene_type:complete